MIGNEAVRLIKHGSAKPLFLVPFNAGALAAPGAENTRNTYAKFAEPRRTYAGMLAAMDEQIGRILAAMEEESARC